MPRSFRGTAVIHVKHPHKDSHLLHGDLDSWSLCLVAEGAGVHCRDCREDGQSWEGQACTTLTFIPTTWDSGHCRTSCPSDTDMVSQLPSGLCNPGSLVQWLTLLAEICLKQTGVGTLITPYKKFKLDFRKIQWWVWPKYEENETISSQPEHLFIILITNPCSLYKLMGFTVTFLHT